MKSDRKFSSFWSFFSSNNILLACSNLNSFLQNSASQTSPNVDSSERFVDKEKCGWGAGGQNGAGRGEEDADVQCRAVIASGGRQDSPIYNNYSAGTSNTTRPCPQTEDPSESQENSLQSFQDTDHFDLSHGKKKMSFFVQNPAQNQKSILIRFFFLFGVLKAVAATFCVTLRTLEKS